MHKIPALQLGNLSLVGLMMALLLIANYQAILKVVEKYVFPEAEMSDTASAGFGKSNLGFKQQGNRTTSESGDVLFYRMPANNQSTIINVEGDWRFVVRHSVVANSTPSDATMMPIIVNASSGEVNGFVYSAYAETRGGPPRVRILALVHNRSQVSCLFQLNI